MITLKENHYFSNGWVDEVNEGMKKLGRLNGVEINTMDDHRYAENSDGYMVATEPGVFDEKTVRMYYHIDHRDATKAEEDAYIAKAKAEYDEFFKKNYKQVKVPAVTKYNKPSNLSRTFTFVIVGKKGKKPDIGDKLNRKLGFLQRGGSNYRRTVNNDGYEVSTEPGIFLADVLRKAYIKDHYDGVYDTPQEIDEYVSKNRADYEQFCKNGGYANE
jgi:hypothetical protein